MKTHTPIRTNSLLLYLANTSKLPFQTLKALHCYSCPDYLDLFSKCAFYEEIPPRFCHFEQLYLCFTFSGFNYLRFHLSRAYRFTFRLLC